MSFHPRLRANLLQIVLALSSVAVPESRGDVFGSGANIFTIDFVSIGNAGNGNDAGAGGGSYSSPYGGVSYNYRISTTEAAQDWITQATNLGLTGVVAGASSGSMPAADMTWFEAAAFVNWLNTNSGHQAAYNLNASATMLSLWPTADAWQAGGQNLYRHQNTFYFLPDEDEWYKAAFHKNNGPTADYWDYATGTNEIPYAVASGLETGTVVYDQPSGSGAVAVSSAGGLSPYGTRGQPGNVFEWLENAYDGVNDSSSESRTTRGGDWYQGEFYLRSSNRSFAPPTTTQGNIGFRVASVPEPSVTFLVAGSLMVSFGLFRPSRKRLP